jgi:23S rRNA pseudouridine2605 synthase/16S rRNA pseudouridine516 synthase
MDRLQKVLARAGVASRRAAERLIEEGRVRVNGKIVTRLGTRVDAQRDAISVDGRRIPNAPSQSLYLMLNKPRGYVCTLSDPEGRPTVRDLLKQVRRRVYPVGRLDFDSEGLLLLTDDGDLARDLTHPSRHVPKTYSVKVRGLPSREALRRLARGIRLDGRRTLPCRVRVAKPGDNSWVEITIHEGRKHQVRRMLAAVGYPVLKLNRIRFGGLRLGNLARGRARYLTPDEVAHLREAARREGQRHGRRRRSTARSGPA